MRRPEGKTKGGILEQLEVILRAIAESERLGIAGDTNLVFLLFLKC